jgi:hypothetical protein
MFGSPFTDEALLYQDYPETNNLLKLDAYRQLYSLGAGLRQRNFGLDVTWVYQQQQSKQNPYSLSDEAVFSPTLVNETVKSSIVASFSFNF